MTTITVTKTGPSTCSDYRGAIDACVTVDGVEGEVTLLPREQDGMLDSWGPSIDFWASDNLHSMSRETQREVIEAVREAVGS